MKIMAKTLTLVLLLTVICSSTYIAVLAAEDPTANAQARAAAGSYDYGVLLPKSNGSGSNGNIEDAPALRIDTKVVIPQLTEETDDTENPVPPPNTGAVSDTLALASAVLLLGAAVWVKKGRGLTVT